MASFTLPTPSTSRFRFNAVLWIFLGVTTLFVFITSEVLLFVDYPMYHTYRLQVIADRGLLIPHALCGTLALLAGPLQFSSRFRQGHLKLHRVVGRLYFISVIIGAFSRDRPCHRTSRAAWDRHARRCLDRLHYRCRDRRA